MVDPELIQSHQRLPPFKVLGEQECPGGESSCQFEEDDFPVFDREQVPPVVLVFISQDGAGEDAAAQVIDFHGFVECVFQSFPEAGLSGLVEVLHLWGDVGEGEGILVRLGYFGVWFPGEVGATGQMATIQPSVRVEVITCLDFGGDAGILGEIDPGAGQELQVGDSDVPAHPAGELARPAQGQGEMGVVDDGRTVELH